MKRLSGLFSLLAVALAVGAAHAGNTMEIDGATALLGESDAEYAARQKSAFNKLALDFDKITPATTLKFELSDVDRLRLADKECKECKAPEGSFMIRVGINGAVEQLVEFASIDAKVLSALYKPVDHAGGVLRRLSTGELVWTVGIESPAAGGLRAEIADMALPQGAELYLYNWSGESYGPYVGAGPMDDGDFWTNSIQGEVAFLELRFPPSVSVAEIQGSGLRIVSIAHLDDTLFPNSSDKKCTGLTDDCSLDANCADAATYTPLPQARRAMGRMLFSAGGGQALCSGGLIRDTDDASEIPFFLTANHCLSTQTSASSLEVSWNYTTPACDAECPDTTGFRKTLGSRLLATGPTPQVTDFTLLRLNGNPPAGSFYLGWTRASVASTAGTLLYRLAHPAGAPLQFTVHKVDPSQFCDDFAPRTRFIYTVNEKGGTQGGASGSPILNAQGLVVGQLLGACGSGLDNRCANATQFRVVDGAFATTYNRISEFIDPPEPVSLPLPNQWYLAEGVTGPYFDTQVMISNPNSGSITVEVTFLTEKAENSSIRVTVGPYARQTVLVDDYVANDSVSVSLREVDGKPFAAERAIYSLDANGKWLGGHTATAVTQPSNSWYFPEGATVRTGGPNSNFETYFLVANPNTTDMPVRVTFFLSDGSVVEKSFTAPAQRRLTVAANPGLDPALTNAAFSTRIESTDGQRFFSERSMWWRASNSPHASFTEGTASAGLTGLSTTWYLAEGDTATGDEFILIVNPNPEPTLVELEYLRTAAEPVVKTISVGANNRTTVNVRYDEAGLGGGELHGTIVRSLPNPDVPGSVAQQIAVERSSYTSSGAATNWIAGHNTVASPITANAWVLTEGAQLPTMNTQIAIVNPNNQTIGVTVLYLLAEGTEVRRSFNIAPKQRLTLRGTDELLLQGKYYSTVVLTTANVVVERSSTFQADGFEVGGSTCSMGLPIQVSTKSDAEVEAVIQAARVLAKPATVATDVTVPTPTVTPTPVPIAR